MTERMEEGIKEMFARSEAEKENLSATELILDGTNQVSFPGYPYKFTALNKKILVSIDIFRSGYECRACKGKKRLEVKCSCEIGEHPGVRYSNEEIAAIKENLGSDISDARAALPCPECEGDYVSMRHSEICSACKGMGALLVLPDTSKNLPTTGVVVSIGNRVNLSKIDYKVGDRILFGPYAGSMIPTKSGLLFKVLDASNAWARVDGANDLGAFEFILNEDSE